MQRLRSFLIVFHKRIALLQKNWKILTSSVHTERMNAPRWFTVCFIHALELRACTQSIPRRASAGWCEWCQWDTSASMKRLQHQDHELFCKPPRANVPRIELWNNKQCYRLYWQSSSCDWYFTVLCVVIFSTKTQELSVIINSSYAL